MVTKAETGTPDYTTLPGYQSTHPTILSPYINHPVVSQDPASDPSLIWAGHQENYSLPALPRNPGHNPVHTYPPAHRHSAPSSVAAFSQDYNIWLEPQIHLLQHSQQEAQRQVHNPQRIVPGGGVQSYAPYLQQANSQGDNRAGVAFSPSLQLPMRHMQYYPSPHSDVSKDETRSSTLSILPSNEMSPKMMFAASPSTQSHHSPSSTGKKGEEPPRDARGQITCSHPKCAGQPPVFLRRCEWT